MGSYVTLLQNLCHNTCIEMVSLWYAFLCLDDRIELVRHDRSRSYAYIFMQQDFESNEKWQILNVTAKKLWLREKEKEKTHYFSSIV